MHRFSSKAPHNCREAGLTRCGILLAVSTRGRGPGDELHSCTSQHVSDARARRDRDRMDRLALRRTSPAHSFLRQSNDACRGLGLVAYGLDRAVATVLSVPYKRKIYPHLCDTTLQQYIDYHAVLLPGAVSRRPRLRIRAAAGQPFRHRTDDTTALMGSERREARQHRFRESVRDPRPSVPRRVRVARAQPPRRVARLVSSGRAETRRDLPSRVLGSKLPQQQNVVLRAAFLRPRDSTSCS